MATGPTPGHGHVIPNPDGSLARCGGPAACPECRAELSQLHASGACPLCGSPLRYNGPDVACTGLCPFHTRATLRH